MLKSQQKVDIKLSKICQSHQKLSEWQKVASRFTEIVVKMWKCRSRFKLFVGLFVELLDSLKQGTTGNWILMTQMLAPANRAWVFWLCWLCWCSGKQASFYIIWMNCTVNELVFAFSFVSSNNTDVETTEQFILLHTRYVCDFSVLTNFSRNSETRRKHLYRTLFTSSAVFLLLTHNEFFDAFEGKKFRVNLRLFAYFKG